MKIGLCTIAALNHPLIQVIQMATKAGLDGLEVTAKPPHLDPEQGVEVARKIGQMVRSAGLDVIAYGSYLGRDDQSDAEREVAIAVALDTKIIRVWAEGRSFEQTVNLLQTTCDLAAKNGIEVVVERHRDSFADTPDRIEHLFHSIERSNVGLNYQVLDLKHGEPILDVPPEIKQLMKYTEYVHLKNYKAVSEEEGYLPFTSLASGLLDYRSIIKALISEGCKGPLMIEFLSDDSRISESILAKQVEYIRDVLKTA
jgi:sugar phosphate isomerase/epimerase